MILYSFVQAKARTKELLYMMQLWLYKCSHLFIFFRHNLKNLKKQHLHGKKPFDFLENNGIISTFALLSKIESYMVAVVQLVRASDCGSECRRFESDQPPQRRRPKSLLLLYEA